ncbi:DUF397 domain-containing protein [Streptomyces sp. NBC_00038]|uniref:DUF397 domain-containing protein n=1 Tax=Streptomyces sp. NBC_00038 TaxID=2903615 RepID=UPI00224DA899|nr:DUF397 domain-containing protein [Streptomyces sp. NBC_00038]MCX5556662.1 DUF397 domain-containing protein [Streptomyces sp. NBC_00038]
MRNEDSSGFTWRKSSYSGADGQCVEVAFVGGAVIIRDSGKPFESYIAFPGWHWQAFVTAFADSDRLVGPGGSEG